MFYYRTSQAFPLNLSHNICHDRIKDVHSFISQYKSSLISDQKSLLTISLNLCRIVRHQDFLILFQVLNSAISPQAQEKLLYQIILFPKWLKTKRIEKLLFTVKIKIWSILKSKSVFRFFFLFEITQQLWSQKFWI